MANNYVLIGQSLAKIPFDLADSMQLLGKDARYVKISGNAKDALDFHIAYYIGELAAKEPDAYFHIISKDKGFDPLIRHLKDRKIRVQREVDIGEIPLLQLSDDTSMDEKIAAIVKNLGGRGLSRPRKVRTLQNTINSLFTPKLEQAELNALVKEMQKRKLIVVNQNNVNYKLPH
jgi:hypothetical protein